MDGCNPITEDQLMSDELGRIWAMEPHVGEVFWIKNELYQLRTVDLTTGKLRLHPHWD